MDLPQRMDFCSPLTLKFSDSARKRIQEGKKIISLGLGESPYQTPLSVKEGVVKALQEGHTKYSNRYGLSELRELIKKK